MLPVCVYSHRDYLDVLRVNEHYLPVNRKNVLITNSLDETTFQQTIHYDDSLPYAQRLTASLAEIKQEYILFMHDMDIVISADWEAIDGLVDTMRKHGLDRVDLKNAKCEQDGVVESVGGLRMHPQPDTARYIYNVNPSVWRVSSFLDVLSKFPQCTYRTIESLPVQHYCAKTKKMSILSDKKVIECGYFQCVPQFQFLHITHGGHFLPMVNNRLDPEIHEEYTKMRFGLLSKSTRKTRIVMWDDVK
jgi:hypothetical protein